MAKQEFSPKDIKDIKEYSDLLKNAQSQWISINKELEKHNKYVTSNTKEALKAQLKVLIDEHGTYKDLVASLKEYESLLKKIEKQQQQKVKSLEKEKDLQEDIEKSSKNQLTNFDELNELQRSITGEYKRQYIDAGAIEKKIDSTKALVGGINTFLEKNTNIQGRQKELIEEAADQYKNMPISVANLRKQLKNGSINQKEYNKALYEMADTFEETLSKLDTEDEKLKDILETLQKMKEETNAWNNAMVKTGEAGEFFFDKTFGSMPGGIGEFANSMKEARKELKQTGDLSDLTVAGAGYLAARAKFYAGNAAGLIQPTGSEPVAKSNDSNVLMQLSSQLKYLDATADKYNTLASASEKFYMNSAGLTKLFAEFDFQTQSQLSANEFEKTSKTAFFGNSLGSAKYAADQVQMAGISADMIASTMAEMSSGANSSMQGLSEDVAVFSKKTGIASSQVASLTRLFRMLNKTGGTEAFNTLQKSLSGTLGKGFNIADIANEMANSSEIALFYNVKSSEELIKQITSVKQLGGEYSKIADAGKSMVLNYRDTIRKSMQLSTMLGENIDLSEVMALFASDRPDEAFKVLKQSGILEKVQNSSMQARETFNSLFPMMQLAGPKYELGPKQSLKSNQEFLKANQEALKQFEIKNAIINVERGGLRELLQYAPGNLGDESVNQQLAKLREGAFADAMGTMIDIQKFALKEGKIVNEIPLLGGPLKSALDLVEQPDSIYNPYLSGQFPKYNEKTKGTTPFQNPYIGASPQDIKRAEQRKKLEGIIRELEKSTPQDGKIKGGLFNLSEVFSKPMSMSNESLSKIDKSSNAQTGLLQNLQTIMATMSNLTDPTLGLKLVIDGKDVKSRIEKIQAREKGKTKN